MHIVEASAPDVPNFQTDPLGNALISVSGLEGDALVGYRRVGGTAGSALLPNLAASVPRPTNGGLTYTFRLRPNLVYSNGDPVRASDFRRAVERSFQVDAGLWGPFLFPSIEGANACIRKNPEGFDIAVERCDLAASDGIIADDVANTVVFNLTTPDEDFVYRLGHLATRPVPDGMPMNELVEGRRFRAPVRT